MTAMILSWMASYWLLIAAVVVGLAAIANPVMVWKLKAWILLAVVAWWGFTGHAAHDSLKLETAQAEAKTLREALAGVEAERVLRLAAQKKADELAKLPPKVIERVRNNPSGCTLPRVVTDSVREQVRATNDAIRSVR